MNIKTRLDEKFLSGGAELSPREVRTSAQNSGTSFPPLT